MGAASCTEKCSWSPSCDRDGGVYLDLVTAIPSHGSCGAFDEELIEVECPAGATFPETVQNLNALDRHFLHFCGSSNVVVVRWLLHFGASPFAHDSNNTTGVHVACRAGSAGVLQELLRHRPSLDRADVAGWTPLHVAARMSRCSLVVILLKVGAPLGSRNSHGELPSEMCLDEATHMAFSSYQEHLFSSSRSPWSFQVDRPDAEDAEAPLPTPFFTPQHPIASFRGHKDASQIGVRIFNAQPGYGIAFIRAVGLVHDYPRSASKFLLQETVDRKAVGNFLGETFAMCDTLRLAFFSRCDLWNTGVVSALLQACHGLEWPDDLQKVNRLVHALAINWWTCHEEFADEEVLQPDDLDEIRGLELKSKLGNAENLSFLFLSCLCLHHYLHECAGRMEPEIWRKFHESIETVPPVVLHKIFAVIRRHWIPQFSIPFLSSKNFKRCEPLPVRSSSLPWLHGIPAIQGWLSVESIPPHDIGYRSKRELWISISLGLLCFSLSPSSAAPEACLALTGLQSHWDRERVVLQKHSGSRSDAAATAGKADVMLAHLKADGSWKECQFQKMELSIGPSSQEDPQKWLQWLADSAIDINSV